MDLEGMRGRVRRDLRDEVGEIERWADEVLDRHIERAVRELSLAAPLEASATLVTSAGSRELSLASLDRRVSVDAVEYPAGRFPPSYVRFSTWGDALTLLVDAVPGDGENVTVRYARLHDLHAGGTTIPEALHDIVATGAAGYAALEWSSYATNRVNVGGPEVERRYAASAERRLAAFRADLAARSGEARPVAAAVHPAGRRAWRAAARGLTGVRTLTPALEAAQRAPSQAPRVSVALADADLGAHRLRWERWWIGFEDDTPVGAAVAGDGALVRARITAAGALQISRLPTPSPVSDWDFSWSGSLGSVLLAAGLGLAIEGSTGLLATVATDARDVQVRTSSNGGSSWGSPAVVDTAGADVDAVACALQPDGSGLVLYAAAGVVYALTRSGAGGSWSSAAAWTLELATVDGLSAGAHGDWQVLVSGTIGEDGAAGAGVWHTILGADVEIAAGQWAPLTALGRASAGTLVTYRPAAVRFIQCPRASYVESYAGPTASAFHRAYLATPVASAAFTDFVTWRDPTPLEAERAWGAAIASDTTDAYLVTSDAAWHAPVGDTPTWDLTPDVLDLAIDSDRSSTRVRLTLRADEGRYRPDAGDPRHFVLMPGGELRVGLGFVTPEGPATLTPSPYWITAIRRSRDRGRATLTVEALDSRGWLRLARAPRQLTWAQGEATVVAIAAHLAARGGFFLGNTDASDEAAVDLLPAFTVRAGETYGAALDRLLEKVQDTVLAAGYTLLMTELDEGDPTTYAYGPDHHPVHTLHLADPRPPVGWARAFGAAGHLEDAVDANHLERGAGFAFAVDQALDAEERTLRRAETIVRRASLTRVAGELTAQVNIGQEIEDVVVVNDPTLGFLGARFRVTGIRVRLERQHRGRFDMTLALGEV